MLGDFERSLDILSCTAQVQNVVTIQACQRMSQSSCHTSALTKGMQFTL